MINGANLFKLYYTSPRDEEIEQLVRDAAKESGVSLNGFLMRLSNMLARSKSGRMSLATSNILGHAAQWRVCHTARQITRHTTSSPATGK